MSNPAAPPRVFVSFLPAALAPAMEPLRVTRYVVERIVPVRGRPPSGLAEGSELVRVESPEAPAAQGSPLSGVTQHLLYTDAAARGELVRASRGESGPVAVLVPIAKAPSWWALAQDERQAFFRRGAAPGHVAVGLPFAGRIFRRLYHARYLPGAEWDFLTYFEFPREETGSFQELLAGLRDPDQNPEWRFVDRETEIWMRKA